jgi:hypothetical protein
MIGFADGRVFLWMEGAETCVILSFEGSQNSVPHGIGELNHRTNYFLENQRVFTDIRGFSTVVYDELWPGISLFYRSTEMGTKYEFHVMPGADPDSIRVRCEGGNSLDINEDSVTIRKDGASFVDEGLKVYQDEMEMDAHFVQHDSQTFGFKVNDYDRAKMLLIDPLLYSTFVCGTDDEGDSRGKAIVVDSAGSSFVAGEFMSTNFLIDNQFGTWELFRSGCFVIKMSPDGSSLLYSTFVGGSGMEFVSSIAIDSLGNAYVCGSTTSTDFPLVNEYDDYNNGALDCFVFKLNPSGNELLFSTYAGGHEGGLHDDYAYSIALDSSGNAYVTGETNSIDFPTVNAYDSTFNSGDNDCFVFKLSTNGSTLLYSTYIGGNDREAANSIAVDSSGNAYVTGRTYSFDFPMANALDDVTDGDDCFVLKLDTTGNLLCSTFIGGTGAESGESIAVSATGDVFVTGWTTSDFPLVNAYDDMHNGEWDCFVFKLNSDCDSIQYSTYVGGSGQDYPHSIAVDLLDNVYVTGYTTSVDFPTVNATDSSYNGGSSTPGGDCFVARLNPTGDSLLYSTFIGGSYDDIGIGIAVDSSGFVYVTGETGSADFPTENAYIDAMNGWVSCFVFKLNTTESGSSALDSSYPMVLAAAGGGGFLLFLVLMYLMRFRLGLDIIYAERLKPRIQSKTGPSLYEYLGHLRSNRLSYVAMIGLLVIALSLQLPGMPLSIFAVLLLLFSTPFSSSFYGINIFIGLLGFLGLLALFAVFFLPMGAVYGISKDILDGLSDRPRRFLWWIRNRLSSFAIGGALQMVVVLAPIAAVGTLVVASLTGFYSTLSWMMLTVMIMIPLMIPAALSGLMIGFVLGGPQMVRGYFMNLGFYWTSSLVQFGWAFFALGLTSMVLPGLVSGLGISDAFRQSLRICRNHSRRVFGLWAAFFATFALVIVPTVVWATFLYPNPPFPIGLFDYLMTLWAVVGSFLVSFIAWPVMVLGFMKLNQEVGGKATENDSTTTWLEEESTK